MLIILFIQGHPMVRGEIMTPITIWTFQSDPIITSHNLPDPCMLTIFP